MSAIIPENNPIVTRLRKKRDLETTMTTLKQLLEPSLKTGSRKKNKPRSIAKKTPKVNRYENISIGEYYPNKLKRKVRLKKTVLRPKHDLKVVVATNKRKRCTPLKGIDLSVTAPDKTTDSTTYPPSNTTNKQTECLNIYTTIPNTSMYKLISPPHRSLTQLTVDDLIRMDEDSLSGEDMMEILTCPSPVWWEDPAELHQGTVYLTEASKPLLVVDKNIEEKIKTENMPLKRSSISVTASKARKIAKLENILGHIKSLVKVDDDVTKNINDSHINIFHKDRSVSTEDIPEVNETDRKRKNIFDQNDSVSIENIPEVNDTDRTRKISSSSSDITINDQELLRDLENIDIPIRNTVDDNSQKDVPNICNLSVDKVEDINNSDKEKSPINKTKRYRGKKVLVNKKTVVANKQEKNRDEIAKKEDTKNESKKEETPPEPDKSVLKRLTKQNDDILDIRLIKIPTNVTNEVKVWSKIENFKRHNFVPTDFKRNFDEYAISISKTKIQEKDPLEINNETILIDDDSNDTAIDNINVEQTVTMTKSNATNKNMTETAHLIVKDPGEHKKIENIEEINIIKEDTIHINNDLDIKLIETDEKSKPNIEIKDITSNRSTKTKESTPDGWHVKNYLKFGSKTNKRGIFRVDDVNDTILCINDVDVSLVKTPKFKENDCKSQERLDDVSITLVSNCKVGTNKVVSESPKSIKSVSSESIGEFSDTISDTNIQFIDEYENKNVSRQ